MIFWSLNRYLHFFSIVKLFIFVQEPDDQEAPDDHDASPPEDTTLYPHSPGTQYQQVKEEPD